MTAGDDKVAVPGKFPAVRPSLWSKDRTEGLRAVRSVLEKSRMAHSPRPSDRTVDITGGEGYGVHGVESKREERGSSIVYRSKDRANYRLIYKRDRRKTPCRLPKQEHKAEYQCQALLTMGAGKAGGGRQGLWGQ